MFDGPSAAWVGQGVEVIGAIDELKVPGADPRALPTGFLVWSVFESPANVALGSKGSISSLESLVRYPKGAEGRVVTASGTFRGAMTGFIVGRTRGARPGRFGWCARWGSNPQPRA